MLSESDRVKFLAVLPKLVEYAKTREAELTKQEVESFFKEISLTKEHYDQIYAYLLANKISVKDGKVSQKDIQKYEKNWKLQEGSVDREKDENSERRKRIEKKEKQSIYLQMYLQDLDRIPACSAEEEVMLYHGLLQGDKEAQKRLAEGKLYRVVELVREYVDDSMVTEDLIQEGNMGLLAALSELFNAKKQEDCAAMIDDYIRQSVALAADAQIHEKDQESKILAKINLIHEAARILALELGRVATIFELAEYTKLSVEEIGDIINLSEGSIDIGSGDIDGEGTKF